MDTSTKNSIIIRHDPKTGDIIISDPNGKLTTFIRTCEAVFAGVKLILDGGKNMLPVVVGGVIDVVGRTITVITDGYYRLVESIGRTRAKAIGDSFCLAMEQASRYPHYGIRKAQYLLAINHYIQQLEKSGVHGITAESLLEGWG